jgi:enoyl-CoA hydratase/carnithine racemase
MADQLAGGKLLLDEPAEAVARLTLNRPEARNALDHELLDGLAAAMPELDRGIEVRCVVITGAGKAFSAGYDIAGIPSDTFERDAEALVAHPFQAALDAVAAHPWPVIAAINGHALGGGLELTLTCDLRIAARSAKLGMPPARLGLIYGHTGLRRFIDAIGVPRTRSSSSPGATSTRRRRGDRPGQRVAEDEEIERPRSSSPPRSPRTRRSR